MAEIFFSFFILKFLTKLLPKLCFNLSITERSQKSLSSLIREKIMTNLKLMLGLSVLVSLKRVVLLFLIKLFCPKISHSLKHLCYAGVVLLSADAWIYFTNFPALFLRLEMQYWLSVF